MIGIQEVMNLFQMFQPNVVNNQEGKQQLSQLVEQTNNIVNSGKSPMQIMKEMNIPSSYIQKIRGFLNTPFIGPAILNYAESKGYKKEDILNVFDTLSKGIENDTFNSYTPTTQKTTLESGELEKYKKYTKYF